VESVTGARHRAPHMLPAFPSPELKSPQLSSPPLPTPVFEKPEVPEPGVHLTCVPDAPVSIWPELPNPVFPLPEPATTKSAAVCEQLRRRGHRGLVRPRQRREVMMLRCCRRGGGGRRGVC
jgi:hypothetical protein